MGREIDGYRDNLEMLNLRFPASDMLSIDQCMEATGLCRNTIRKHLGKRFVAGRISKVFLAKYMCG